MQCQACGSTFSQYRSWFEQGCPAICPGCGSVKAMPISADGPSGPAEITCKTCSHTWPITGPHSIVACPSCGGNPLVKGQLVDDPKKMTTVWKPPLAFPSNPPVPQEVIKAQTMINQQISLITGINSVQYSSAPYNYHGSGAGNSLQNCYGNYAGLGNSLYNQDTLGDANQAPWTASDLASVMGLTDKILGAKPAAPEPERKAPLLEFGGPRKIVVPR